MEIVQTKHWMRLAPNEVRRIPERAATGYPYIRMAASRIAVRLLYLRPSLDFLAIDQHLEMRDGACLIADETNFERRVCCSK